MPSIAANGIELYTDSFGDPDDPTLLLVSGLGAQCLVYDDAFCALLVDTGLHVVRFDNRDVGLSTHLSEHPADPMSALVALGAGEPLDAPYTLSDMAADAIALLDALGVPDAHVFGASMGGMIAQTMAIEYPERIRTLTTLMSTTGEPAVGAPKPETLATLLAVLVPQTERAARIDQAVLQAKVIGTPQVFDEARATERATTFVDRAYDPAGTGRQLVAIFASGSRAKELEALELPTVVMHGDADPLVDISGGRRTAELVPGAQFRVLEGMGHDMPPQYWAQIIEGITANTNLRGTRWDR